MRAIGLFLRDEGGATALEYAMMAMLVALSGVLSFRMAGGNVERLHIVIMEAMQNLNK